MDLKSSRLLNQKEVANITGMSEAWLEQCRFKKTGIPWVKLGRSVKYSEDAVAKFIRDNTIGTGI